MKSTTLALCASIVLIALPLSAVAKPYTSRVACSHKKKADPSRYCRTAEKKGAFFRSNEADVRYTVCVKFPTGSKLCAEAQDAAMGSMYLNKITSRIRGRHVVTWTVGGSKVAKFGFRVS